MSSKGRLETLSQPWIEMLTGSDLENLDRMAIYCRRGWLLLLSLPLRVKTVSQQGLLVCDLFTIHRYNFSRRNFFPSIPQLYSPFRSLITRVIRWLRHLMENFISPVNYSVSKKIVAAANQVSMHAFVGVFSCKRIRHYKKCNCSTRATVQLL